MSGGDGEVVACCKEIRLSLGGGGGGSSVCFEDVKNHFAHSETEVGTV